MQAFLSFFSKKSKKSRFYGVLERNTEDFLPKSEAICSKTDMQGLYATKHTKCEKSHRKK